MNTESLTTEQHHLFSLMAQVERRYRAHLTEALASLDVSLRQYEVLLIIQREGAPSPAAIATAASVTRQLIHRQLLDLEQRQLVQRWSHHHDPTTVRVALTPSGQEVLVEAQAVVESIAATVVRQVGVERQLAMRAMLVALDDALREVRRRPELVDG
jgi:DNA-binding MarR family transcriptional regulator